jgi:F-type H+-transporting ATPase subunit gamma
MANIREIRQRIKSIKETKQITKAMKLISAAKLRKARGQLAQAFPYFDKVKSTMADIIKKTGNNGTGYFDTRADKKDRIKGYIVVTADKGMAGGYNHNIYKMADALTRGRTDCVLYMVGQMGRHRYHRAGGVKVDAGFDFSVQNATVYRAREVVEYVVKEFNEQRVDEVSIIFTYMHSAFRLEPTVMKLLPLDAADFKVEEDVSGSPYKTMPDSLYYQPSPEYVLDSLVPKYLKGVIYGAFVESYTSENSARMTAMDNATSNADKILGKLNTYYNRTRQASITQEISEIISGANAQEN